MTPADQALIVRTITNLRRRTEFAVRESVALTAGLSALREPPAPHPELDALLDALELEPANDNPALDEFDLDLPCDLEGVAAPVVTDLEGRPVEPSAAVPELVTSPASATSSSTLRPHAPRAPRLVTTKPARPRKLRRRSGLRQREDAHRMRAHGRQPAGEVVEHLPPSTLTLPPHTLSPSTSPITSRSASTSYTSTKPRGRTTIIAPTYRRLLAPWQDAGELPRTICANRALGELGRPYAFSVNLDPALIEAANENRRGSLDYLRRRVALALKRAFGRTPPMWVALETDDEGRQHLHGGLALNDAHSPVRVAQVLAKAGGSWTRQGSAPADVRPMHDLDGWTAYCFKRAARTRRHIREDADLASDAPVPLVSYSADLRAAGRRLHEEARRAIGRGASQRELTDQGVRQCVQGTNPREATGPVLAAPRSAPADPAKSPSTTPPRRTQKGSPALRRRGEGTMHYAALAVGDQHAELWEELGITHRRVEAGEDVSVAEHPSLGRCIISHTGLEDRVEWWSERPIEVWDPAPEPRPVPAVAPGLLLRVTGRRPCRIRL